MAGLVVIVIICATLASTVSNAQKCPSTCTCTILEDKTLGIYCSKQTAGGFVEDWPPETSKLNLSNSGQQIKWSALSSLKNLKELDLTGNNVNCNCDYYKYWKNNIHPSSGLKIKGACAEPSSRKGRSLSQVGAGMKQECDRSKLFDKTSPHVVISTQKPMQSYSQKQIKPTATLSSSTATSETEVLKSAGPVKIGSIKESSSKAMPSTTSASMASSASVTRHAVVPAPVQTAIAATTTSPVQETTSSAYERSTTSSSTQITTEKQSTTTEQPTTTAAPPPITTEQPTTAKQPTTTKQPTTAKPQPPVIKTQPPTTTKRPTTTEMKPETTSVQDTTSEATSPERTTTESPMTEEATTDSPPTPPKPGPPTIILYLQSSVVKIGSVVDVICKVEGFPKPEVDVTVNGKDAKSVFGMFQKQKTGAKVVFEAKFTSEVICYAKNKFGMKKETLRVEVKEETMSFFSLVVKLSEEKYSDDYKDKGSVKFRDLQSRLNKALSYVFNEFYGFYGATLLSARSGSVIADVLIKTTNSTRDRAKKILEENIQTAKFGSIPVDRGSYYFKDKTEVCPGEFLNVTWSDMLVNETAIAECPRGAKGIAKRNCTENGWYYPDYTQCISDPFAEARKKMRLAALGPSSAPSLDILSVLSDVKNITVAFRDYSHIAGDLNSCVEIIEMLTNYTKHHRNDIGFNDDEAKLVVDITSNLLNKNHEQEFIISQKLIQKASTLIRVVEKYGLQAAAAVSNGTNELKFFIAENVVMGVGLVEPLTITNDVTFPNYELPEVDSLRTAWGSSSFIVIDKEVIEDLTKVKNFKVAGFLYRTLTRILSAESAYSMVGQGFEINSAVVSLTLDPPLPPKLKTPVIIASNNLDEVRLDGDSPICAFWDFNLNEPNGGWSDKGCWYTHYNTHNTTCLCDHLTNFAVLKEKPVFFPQPQKAILISPPFFLCILIGCIIMICFCAITLILLLIFAWRMRPDRTWGMHMFVCATLITAFALIIVGLYKYDESVFFCRLLSMLVHYFFLCAFTWIMAEGVYMYVWTTTEGPKKRYWIGYFFIGFVPAGIPLAVTWLIQGMQRFESVVSCWMSLSNVLLWVFFIPAAIFLLITILIFRQVWRTATGNLRVPLKATYWRTRFRVHVRYCIAIQILLIITWLCGNLVLTYYMYPLLELIFCILFIIFCVITGFVIIVFYCIADRQFDDAFRECCCFCCNQGKYEVQKREDLWAEQHPEPVQHAEVIRPEQQSILEEEQHDPLIVYVTRKKQASEPSMSSEDDPLYERVKKPDERPEPKDEEEGPREEPVYAKVHKDEPYEDDDPFPVAQPGSPRFQRGLTRLEVIRMAKKSDAAKRELKKYESPKGSQDDLAEHPTYLVNQKELDEELQHFRTFFAESQQSSPKPSTSTTPPGTPTPSSGPCTYSATSSSSSTTKTTRIVKKTTASTLKESSSTRTQTQTHESFESSSTFTHESSTRVIRDTSTDRDTPPAIPPRAPDLLDDDDYDPNESDAKMRLLDVERDDESLTDVSAADDFDKDSDDEGDAFLDGSRPTAV